MNQRDIKNENIYGVKMEPDFKDMFFWEVYSSEVKTEYRQSMEEGLDIEEYKELFEAVAKIPAGTIKEKLADTLFEIIQNAKIREGYEYIEPSDLEGIQQLRQEYSFVSTEPTREELADKIHGAWLGRISGCLLGKTLEGIRTDELIPLLKETNNYPMYRYIQKSEITGEMCKKYRFNLADRCYADANTHATPDDDTNYTAMSQLILNTYGRDFTPNDVMQTWLNQQAKWAYCTAERVAYRNATLGYKPPHTALYKNAYREWIGAQIRIDYFGYINPGDPETAADMAWRDASISHVKNGIYGAMFVAAMIACAAVTNNIEDIIKGGLGQIPKTSRLYQRITELVTDYHAGASREQCFEKIHTIFDEHKDHDWCHTISNAMIVVAALLYGHGDFGKSICMAVETGFDTDCNGATVGSILGMRNGTAGIDRVWTDPLNNKLETTIFSVGAVEISEVARKTLEHLKA